MLEPWDGIKEVEEAGVCAEHHQTTGSHEGFRHWIDFFDARRRIDLIADVVGVDFHQGPQQVSF